MGKAVKIVKLVSAVRYLNSGNGVCPKKIREFIKDKGPHQDSDFNVTLQMAVKEGFLEARGSRVFVPAVGRTSTHDQALRGLRVEVAFLSDRLRELTDELDQFRRSNSLIIYGLVERPGENTVRLVVDLGRRLGVLLQTWHIEGAKRVGRIDPQRPRALLVKFCSYKYRCQLFDRKKRLKGTGIAIVEHLTPSRLEVLMAAKKQFGSKNAWTTDGTVYCKDGEQVAILQVKLEPEETDDCETCDTCSESE